MPNRPIPAKRLSVVLCTYNPRPDLLARSLRAISRQTLHPDAFELVVVDNNSPVMLRTDICERLALREVRVVQEYRQGLTYARVGGINATSAPVICFVDDDNEIAPDYLERVLEISETEAELGAWGGICQGAFEAPVGSLQHEWLPHLGVREAGHEPLTGHGDAWGPHEPIGAGICVRRHVAEGYVAFVEGEGAAGALGRKGNALLSGEDSLISRIAHRLGYVVGYRPQLQLMHHITAPRLKIRYLTRLMHGHGRSYVVLQALSGEPLPNHDPQKAKRDLWLNFRHRLRESGLNHAIGMMFWDRGYQAALAELSGAKAKDQVSSALADAGLAPVTAVKKSSQRLATA